MADAGGRRCVPLGAPHGDPEGPGTVCARGSESGSEMGYPISGAYVRREHIATTLDGIGIVQAYVWRDSTAAAGDRIIEAHGRYLTYARVDGVEVGESRGVASAPGPAQPGPVLRLGPNPTRGPLAVWAERPGALVGVDALGREVARQDVARAGRVRLDLSSRPPGLYVVRFETAEGVATATVSVAR